ncbi:50S ribosomal protein L30 [Porphyromonadaceae bacterium COT-184 OH4590]|nr:50S ribosomal protein L30 [Porphyromonadaceae bacterium COT-184 OH4590]MDO4725970.1 50S ribosomal protein L30 [Porphyromonadaceae bacterium]
MAKIRIQQVKSRIKCPAVQKRTLDALGLHKMNQIVEHDDTPAIMGMVKTVHHLVKILD